MAAALEATPRRARGIVAGFTQQGFAAGYMLASGFHLAMSKISFTHYSIICILLRMLHNCFEMAI
jgi:SHS family lactate transporter-like MFS transporter